MNTSTCLVGSIGIDTICPMYMQYVWGLAINCNRSKYWDSNAASLAMSIKLSIKIFVPIRPVFEVPKLMTCETLEQMLFISHATSLQAVDHASLVSFTRWCFHGWPLSKGRQEAIHQKNVSGAAGCAFPGYGLLACKCQRSWRQRCKGGAQSLKVEEQSGASMILMVAGMCLESWREERTCWMSLTVKMGILMMETIQEPNSSCQAKQVEKPVGGWWISAK